MKSVGWSLCVAGGSVENVGASMASTTAIGGTMPRSIVASCCVLPGGRVPRTGGPSDARGRGTLADGRKFKSSGGRWW